jgi:AcrR family transcriptional regulator
MVQKTVRGSLTRRKLIAAALEVFGRRGFAQATTREIAQLAGVAEGTIYRHFADKQALFHAVFVEAVSEQLELLRHFPERAGTATLRDNLEALLDLLGSMQELTAPLMASLTADAELASGFMRLVQEQGLEGFDPAAPMAATAAFVAAEQKVGRIRCDVDPGEAATLIVAVPFAQGVERTLNADSRRASNAPVPIGIVDVLARGLAPEEAAEGR